MMGKVLLDHLFQECLYSFPSYFCHLRQFARDQATPLLHVSSLDAAGPTVIVGGTERDEKGWKCEELDHVRQFQPFSVFPLCSPSDFTAKVREPRLDTSVTLF